MGKVAIRINLSKLMERKGAEINPDGSKMTQAQLAAATGVPQGTISSWERSKNDRYERRIIEVFLEYFDCELDDLFIVERQQ